MGCVAGGQSRSNRACRHLGIAGAAWSELAMSSWSRAGMLLDHGQMKGEEICDPAHARKLVTDAEGDVVRRSLSAPGVEELPRARCEADPCVRVADLEGRPGN